MMMASDGRWMGVDDGPVLPLNYKRAVVKPAPREFTVEPLEPTKQGSHYSYGVRVCPIFRSKSSRSSSDSRSTTSYSEYEIWRRWEDCLAFQEILEREYGQMSRQKVKVLKRGVTEKKKKDAQPNGPYNLGHAAASFDSLPEGPDPREVILDVHKLIPPLTCKGSLFRASRSTIQQRGDEFTGMIRALFNASEDAPVLLQELRNCTAVRDFFSVWRRDEDLQKKSGKGISRHHSTLSMSSLMTSMTLSSATSAHPSSPTSSELPITPSSAGSSFQSRYSMFTRGTNDYPGEMPLAPASAPPSTSQFVPDSTVTPKSLDRLHTDVHSSLRRSPGSMMFTDELLLQDDSPTSTQPPYHRPVAHNPVSRPAPLSLSQDARPRGINSPNGRLHYSIPEEELPPPQPRARSNSAVTPENRNARIFLSHDPPPRQTSVGKLPRRHQDENSLHSNSSVSDGQNRRIAHASPHSSQSSSHSLPVSSRFSVTSSISSYTDASKRSSISSMFSCDSGSWADLDVATTNSSTIPEARAQDSHPSSRTRDSYASYRTAASADGVLPLHLRPHDGISPNRDSRDIQTPSPSRASPSEDVEDLIDAYFSDAPDNALPRFINRGSRRSIGSARSTGSFNSGTESHTWQPLDDLFTVKAVYNECVIVFRARYNMSFLALRQTIKDRLALQDCIPFHDFCLAYIPSQTSTANNGGVRRSNSVSSATSDLSHPRLLRTEADWQAAMLLNNGKVSLRVLDPETS